MIHTSEAILLGSDVDGTILAGYKEQDEVKKEANVALGSLTMAVAHRRNQRRMPVYFGSVTGRTLASHQELEAHNPTFNFAASYMDFVISSVGAEINVRKDKYAPLTSLEEWPDAKDWEPRKIQQMLATTPDLGTITLQPSEAQSPHKLSFFANTPLAHAEYVGRVAQQLSKWNLAAHVIFSGGTYLDFLPKLPNGAPVNKGAALLHCANFLARRDELGGRPRIIFAGDSENDMGGFRAAIESGGYGIIPANANPDFTQWATREFNDSIYTARKPFAAGVQEGFEHFACRR